MCLIFISLNNHPSYKLIVAANRDEFYQRKTASAHFWEDHPHVLGGRDLEAGGTWMAMSKTGRISMVTNYRDPKNIDPKAPSRGHLVSDYVVNHDPPLSYIQSVTTRGRQYNGFNLIAGTPDELYYYSNYKEGIEPVAPGIHGLSNHLLNTPWPKVQKGLRRMESITGKNQIDPDDLLNALYDDQVAEVNQLPDTGVGLERERALSSMFIKSPGYGSRCSTVVLVDRTNHVTFVERVYDTASFDYKTNAFSFRIDK